MTWHHMLSRGNDNLVSFHYGWVGQRYWCSIVRIHNGTYFLDIGTARIRWASKDFRPFFSERYGYQKWHYIGKNKRLAWHIQTRRRQHD